MDIIIINSNFICILFSNKLFKYWIIWL